MPNKPRKTEPKLPEASEMVLRVMKALKGYSFEHQSKITGQCTIERRGDVPLVVMYATYPNGDYLCWFNDGSVFKLYSLVNEKFQHVMESKACDLPALIEAAAKLEPSLGKETPHTGA
jgi:hypothetical protein